MIIQGDCIQIMKTMPAASVQCVFADPPFNIGKKYKSYDDGMDEAVYLKWCNDWITEAFRVLKDDGSLFIYNIPKHLTKIAPMCDSHGYFRHWISWNSPGRPLGKSLLPSHYGILYYTKEQKGYKFHTVRAPHKLCRKCGEYHKDYGGKKHLRHPFGYVIGDVWDDIHRVKHSSKRIAGHPCQLPPHLIERLLLTATDPGDTLLDLFAGGGSAGVACKQTGRDYIGCEIDQEYVAMATAAIGRAEPRSINASLHLDKVVSQI